MKNIIFAVGVTALIAVLWTFSEAQNGSVEYVAPDRGETATGTPEVIEEVDKLDALSEQLEQINHELDQEEVLILEEKAKLKAEYEARDAEFEARLERIRETRVSFQ